MTRARYRPEITDYDEAYYVYSANYHTHPLVCLTRLRARCVTRVCHLRSLYTGSDLASIEQARKISNVKY